MAGVPVWLDTENQESEDSSPSDDEKQFSSTFLPHRRRGVIAPLPELEETIERQS